MQAGLRHGRLSLAAGIANVLDRLYVEPLSYQRDPYRTWTRVAEPGRNSFLNVAGKF